MGNRRVFRAEPRRSDSLSEWASYDLAERYKRLAVYIAKYHGLDDSVGEEAAHSAALSLCLDRYDVDHPEGQVKRRFLSLVKSCIFRERERIGREPSIYFDLRSDREGTSDEGNRADALKYVQPPTQERTVFAGQCLAALRLLPKKHRDTMMRLAHGDTPTDIALREKVPILDVLERIRVAREWVSSHLKDDDLGDTGWVRSSIG